MTAASAVRTPPTPEHHPIPSPAPRVGPWRAVARDTGNGDNVTAWRRNGAPGAPHLVLVHGFEETWRSWREFVRDLPATFTITSLDLPWRSGSDHSWTDDGTSTRWLARGLALMSEQRPAVDVVVAHSFGATTLLDLMTRYPDRLDGAAAALVAPIYRPHDPADRGEFYDETLLRTRAVLTEGMRVHLAGRADISPAQLESLTCELLDRVAPDGLITLFSTLVRTSRQDLSVIATEALLVAGTTDPSLPPEALRALRRSIPHLRVVQDDAMTHFCQVEQSEAVAVEVAHLAQQIRARAAQPA